MTAQVLICVAIPLKWTEITLDLVTGSVVEALGVGNVQLKMFLKVSTIIIMMFSMYPSSPATSSSRSVGFETNWDG